MDGWPLAAIANAISNHKGCAQSCGILADVWKSIHATMNMAKISPGIRHDLDGVLFQSGSADAITTTIRDLSESAGQRAQIAGKGYERVHGDMTWDSIASQTLKIYETSLRSRTQA